MHSDYSMVRDTYKDWSGHESRRFAPTTRQACVILAVQSALDAGCYYTKDVRAHCAAFLAITPEVDEHASGMRTEGGNFGMDCYYARHVIDARKRHAAEDAAIAAILPLVGLRLGVLVFNDYKRTTGVTIEACSDDGQSVTFTGKRGTATVRGTGSPLQLRHAIERAHELGKRKDTFEEFAAKRAAEYERTALAMPRTEPPTADYTARRADHAAIEAATGFDARRVCR